MGDKDFIGLLQQQEQDDGRFHGPFTKQHRPLTPEELSGEKKKKTPAFPYTHFIDVFVIHRPWESCRKCRKAWEENQPPPGGPDIENPNTFEDDGDGPDGDQICPHTRRAQYLNLMQKFLKSGYRCIDRRPETLKSGVIQITVEWWVPDAKEEAPKPRSGPL